MLRLEILSEKSIAAPGHYFFYETEHFGKKVWYLNQIID